MSSTTALHMRSTGPGAPPSSARQAAQQQQSGGASGRAVNPNVVFTTTNYSVAPGPAWIELTNKTAFTASGVVKIALPPRGAGEYLAHLQLPIAVVVVKPTVLASQMAAMAKAEVQAQQEEQNKKKPPDEKQQEQQAEELQKKMEEVQQEQDKKKEEADKEKEQHKEKQAQEQEKEGEQQAKEFQAQMASGTVLVPPLSTVQQAAEVAELWLPEFMVHGIIDVVGVDESGMSVQGFPGLPRPVSNVSALPSSLGVNSAKIDTTVSPAELDITFAGSGSIPAHSRWLIFTITGV